MFKKVKKCNYLFKNPTVLTILVWTLLPPQVYPWGGIEEEDPGEQYFQNLPTSPSTASPAVPLVSSTGEANIRQPPGSMGPPSPSSPSPSPHLSNTDALGEDKQYNDGKDEN